MASTLFSIFISAVLHFVPEKLPRGIDMQFRIDGELFNLPRLKAKTLSTNITQYLRGLSYTPTLSPIDEGHQQPDSPEVRSRET